MAGSVLVGVAARWLSARGVSVVAFSGLCMAVFALDQIVLIAGLPVPGWLVWTIFGLFGPAGVLTYAILTEAFPSEMAGRVNTTLTLLLFVVIFLFQWGIGIVVSLWPAHGGHHAGQAGGGDVAGHAGWQTGRAGIVVLVFVPAGVHDRSSRAGRSVVKRVGDGDRRTA